MGLDCTWYADIVLLDGEKHEPGTDLVGKKVSFYVNPDFPAHAGDIVDRSKGVYSFDTSGHFFSRSYGAYNGWRNDLAKLAGHASAAEVWETPKPGAFVELINFSDCEGTLGPTVCEKLARDFEKHQPKADAHPDRRFQEVYSAFRNAFETVALNGAVKFS